MSPTRLDPTNKISNIRSFFVPIAYLCLAFLSSCTDIQKPTTEPFYSETTPPTKQEFRWSNGKTPKSFDPARAAAAPETDVIRALFEGLTEIDARTLKETPAVAEKWTSSDDLRIWTFILRKDARWSNGRRVTAEDFVMSWKRLATLGDKAAHKELFQNIVGLQPPKTPLTTPGEPTDFLHSPPAGTDAPSRNESPTAALSARQQASVPPIQSSETAPTAKNEKNGAPPAAIPATEKFGVEAVDDITLKVTLDVPDKDFPKLVANPIFRPIYGDGVEFDSTPLDATVVTNGSFTVASVGKDGISLDRSETYWNKSAVSLEHVRFVPSDNAEAALDAYKKGDIDAVTNVDFEPLALKLLAPYDDFRQTAHSALNFYEVNTKNAPFSDRRVREALAISIDRDRLADGELEGSTQPATSFLPLGDKKNAKLLLDVERAKQLMEKAGFPNGEGFPAIRLLINRNDTQQRVARVVAKMWKQNLNLDTVIDVKDASDLETARAAGDYDLVRRGVVLPTLDESVGMAAIFGVEKKVEALRTILPKESERPGTESAKPDSVPPKQNDKAMSGITPTDGHTETAPAQNMIITEDTAVFELNAIPLYFPMSFSLVKPYVKGFEINGLDAPLLKDIGIDSNWQPSGP